MKKNVYTFSFVLSNMDDLGTGDTLDAFQALTSCVSLTIAVVIYFKLIALSEISIIVTILSKYCNVKLTL